MRFLVTLTIVLSAAVLLMAADESSGVTFVDHDEVAAALGKGGPLVGREGLGTYNVHGSHREKAGQVEVHAKDTDFIYITDGSATFVAGGTIVGGKATRPGQLMGSDIQGGQIYHLSKGDVIVVPAGIPHWFKEVPKSIDYYVVQAAIPVSEAK
jgi:mannose-6-phosphate isomerase-like protein (cupin superfamily)